MPKPDSFVPKNSKDVVLPASREELIKLARSVINDRSKFAPGEMPTRYHEAPPPNEHYIFFPPLYFFESGFIDVETIKRLKKDGNALFVGVGDSHLEKLLVEGFGVPPNNLTLADVYLTPEATHSNSPATTFDAAKPWSKFKKKFKLILFPESLDMAAEGESIETNGSRKTAWGSLITHTAKDESDAIALSYKYSETGPLSQQEQARLFEVLESRHPQLVIEVQILEEALANLEDGGQIRTSNYGGLGDTNLLRANYVKLKLLQKYPNLIITNTYNWTKDTLAGSRIIIIDKPSNQATATAGSRIDAVKSKKTNIL